MKYVNYALIVLIVVTVVGFVVSACLSGMEATLQTFQGIVYLVAIVTAFISVVQYWKNSKREASKWLHELYRGLYGDQELQDVLWSLEAENKSDAQLKKLIDEDDNFGTRFDRFLNFFQFVAVLEHRGELDMKDVMSMFKFPLKLLRQRNAVVEYIRKEEYEFKELRALLERPELQKAGQQRVGNQQGIRLRNLAPGLFIAQAPPPWLCAVPWLREGSGTLVRLGRLSGGLAVGVPHA